MGQYEYEGYSGKMYYSKTKNMKHAENKLFEIRVPPNNSQAKSNVSDESGYVYVIVGTKANSGADSCIIL